MNLLAKEKQLQVLAALVDGNSERAVERITGVNRGTISRLGLTFGAGARRLHDRLVRDLSCSQVEVDEIWGYVQKKAARVTESDPPSVGEAYTFIALDKSSRLVISCVVGKRNEATTRAFTSDLRARLVVMPAITSDGWLPYISAIGELFGKSGDYAQTIKNYSSKGRRNGGDDHRYEPPRDPFITKKAIYGAPDLDRASTSYVERHNGTMRHLIGRMRRLCYAFSKSAVNHEAAWALGVAHYNFCHIVKTLRVTPAMQAALTDHVWTVEEFLDAIISEPAGEAPTAKPLAFRTPDGTSRQLPGRRGFLRVVANTHYPKSSPERPTQAVPSSNPKPSVQLKPFGDDPGDQS